MRKWTAWPLVILIPVFIVVGVIDLTSAKTLIVDRWDSLYKTNCNPDFLKMRQATVEIKVGKAGGAGAIVHIDEEYLYVLTANHIVKRRGTIHVRVKDTSGEATIIKNIPRKNISSSKTVDLSLMKIAKPTGVFGYFPLGKVALIGEDIYTIGHPLNTHYSINKGIVSCYKKRTYNNKKEEYLVVSAPSFSGNSGGAVVDSKTELIGLAVGIMYAGEKPTSLKSRTIYLFHMTYAVRLQDIKKFLEEELLI